MPMMENNNAQGDILEKIRQSIIAGHRCFTNDDVDCNSILIDLRQAQRSLDVLGLPDDSKRNIGATVMALVDQIEMKIQRDRAPSRTKAYSASRHKHADGPGRPKVVIPLNQLQMLHDLNFTASQMAEQFQCSVQLIYKSLYDAGLKQRTRYSNLDDTALDEKIHELQDQYPNAGSVMMDGYLQTQGITMQRKRIRESMRRTSQFPVAHRLSKTIKRRKYSVAMSNSLWHVDGHMKLIRWGISTHGGIDGYSRLITFVKADTNNKATTVLSHFIGACIQFGVPSRVRSDHGGENVMIALFMNLINGQDRRSHITGRSVHNQRIERLWRDIFKEVIHKYYDLFYRMEDRGLLDIDNKFHILALQTVYLPVINEALEVFRNGWNSHKLSTEKNRTPKQIWLSGILQNVNSEATPIANLYGEDIPSKLENRLRRYGLNPVDFLQQEDSNPQQELLNAAQIEVVHTRIAASPNSDDAYTACLEYMTEIGLIS